MKIKQPTTRLTILLADDDPDDYIFFKEALKGLSIPMELIIANDGEQLMQTLNDDSINHPDVLFLDLNMPRKNGFECLSEIRLNNKLKQLPVIIYSTSFHKKIADLLYTNGANYYISKPFEILQLKKAVQEIIMHIEQGDSLQPAREKFILLEEERKNYKSFAWFKNNFTIPLTEKFN